MNSPTITSSKEDVDPFMSLDLYHRRLYYRSTGGVAKQAEVTLVLLKPPILFPTAAEVDYGENKHGDLIFTPFIRESDAHRRRDLTPEEINSIRWYLKRLWSAVVMASITEPPGIPAH